MPDIRFLQPEDAEAYCVLRREMVLDSPHAFIGSPGNDDCAEPATVARRLSHPENEIVAIEDPGAPGRLLASAGVLRYPQTKMRHRAMIWGVYCTPSERGRGFGRALMEAAIEAARSWDGVGVVTLSVSASSPGVIALYESLGFERWGVERDVVRIDGVSYDEVYMSLRL